MKAIGLSPEQAKAKAQICTRLVQAINEYWEAFKKPMPMTILSAQYTKTFRRYGGFNEVMLELRNQGIVQVSLRETGGKNVWPGRLHPELPVTEVMLRVKQR